MKPTERRRAVLAGIRAVTGGVVGPGAQVVGGPFVGVAGFRGFTGIGAVAGALAAPDVCRSFSWAAHRVRR